jgi:hypothetical protein
MHRACSTRQGHYFPPSGTHFRWRLNKPQGHRAAGSCLRLADSFLGLLRGFDGGSVRLPREVRNFYQAIWRHSRGESTLRVANLFLLSPPRAFIEINPGHEACVQSDSTTCLLRYSERELRAVSMHFGSLPFRRRKQKWRPRLRSSEPHLRTVWSAWKFDSEAVYVGFSASWNFRCLFAQNIQNFVSGGWTE